jgi:hypothetical protein
MSGNFAEVIQSNSSSSKDVTVKKPKSCLKDFQNNTK